MNGRRRRIQLAIRTAALLALLLSAAPPARGQSPEPGAPQAHPAYVDGKPFVELADKGDTLVEMLIDRALLKSLAARYAKDGPELSAFLKDLELINSVVVTFAGPVPQPAAGSAAVTLERDLQAKRWRKLAAIREPKLQVLAFIHLAGEDVDGLVVLTVEPQRVIFSNLAGKIDLVRLARLRGTLTIPGLEKLPEETDTSPADPADAGQPPPAPEERP